jgi:hypothetical protein
MDITEYSESSWKEAERRTGIIAQLARLSMCSKTAVERAASELSLSVRQV